MPELICRADDLNQRAREMMGGLGKYSACKFAK